MDTQLHDKRRVYARNSVAECLVVQMYEQRIDWFVLREGDYESLSPDEAGVLQSTQFPGLWLDTAAFWRNDLAAMRSKLQEGLATPAHVAFLEQLQEGS